MSAELAHRLSQGGHIASIYRAVELAYPEEGCGFVFEDGRGQLYVLPTENRATQLHQKDPETYPRDGRTYFEPDMKPWLRASRDGLTPRVIFHSHPDTGAYFSETDRASAIFVDESDGTILERNPGLRHLVVAVQGPQPKAAVSRLFRFVDGSGEFAECAAFDRAGKWVSGEGS